MFGETYSGKDHREIEVRAPKQGAGRDSTSCWFPAHTLVLDYHQIHSERDYAEKCHGALNLREGTAPYLAILFQKMSLLGLWSVGMNCHMLVFIQSPLGLLWAGSVCAQMVMLWRAGYSI